MQIGKKICSKTVPTIQTIIGGQEEESRDQQGKRNRPETTTT